MQRLKGLSWVVIKLIRTRKLIGNEERLGTYFFNTLPFFLSQYVLVSGVYQEEDIGTFYGNVFSHQPGKNMSEKILVRVGSYQATVSIWHAFTGHSTNIGSSFIKNNMDY